MKALLARNAGAAARTHKSPMKHENGAARRPTEGAPGLSSGLYGDGLTYLA